MFHRSLVRRCLRVAAAAVVLIAGQASAALVDRGGGVVFDTETGLDWERSPFSGDVNWHEANAYVAGLALAGGGWRLPDIGELHALYDNISAATGCTDCTGDQGPFENVKLGYWSTLQYFAGQPGAFYVGFWQPSYQAGLFQTSSAWVWAVRAGAELPEPSSALLIGAALLVLAAARRFERRRR